MVKKPNNQYWFCVNYQKVNEVTEPDAYGITRMDSILRKLKYSKYISKIDLKSAYHQIEIKESNQPVAAFFVRGQGMLQFCRIAFELGWGPSTFQGLSDLLIGYELEP